MTKHISHTCNKKRRSAEVSKGIGKSTTPSCIFPSIAGRRGKLQAQQRNFGGGLAVAPRPASLGIFGATAPRPAWRSPADGGIWARRPWRRSSPGLPAGLGGDPALSLRSSLLPLLGPVTARDPERRRDEADEAEGGPRGRRARRRQAEQTKPRAACAAEQTNPRAARVDGELGGARRSRRSGIGAEAEDSGESVVECQQRCSALAARRASGHQEVSQAGREERGGAR
jgi:hypothetical protein